MQLDRGSALHACVFIPVSLFATSWTVAQAPLSVDFSRVAYWSGKPCPLPGDLPDPGTEPKSPALQADSLPSEPPHCDAWNTLNC